MKQCSAPPQRLAFDLEWRLSVATLLLLPLLMSLGFWQLSRADEKTALQARHDARERLAPVQPGELLSLPVADRADRQVAFSASFEPDHYLLLDNRIRRGRAGFEVIALARVSDTLTVPVNVGWVAGDPGRRELPEVLLPSGPVAVRGRVHVPSADAYVLDDEPTPATLPAVVQALPFSAWHPDFEIRFGRQFFPHEVRVTEQDSRLGFQTGWPVVNQQPEKHTAYAVQWFTMAAALLVAFVLRSTNLWSLLRHRN